MHAEAEVRGCNQSVPALQQDVHKARRQQWFHLREFRTPHDSGGR